MGRSIQNRQEPRSRDPERTKGEILEAALGEFADHGYGGAKVQKIAQRAGCNPRLIYHYFGSKDDLYLAALRQIYAELRSRESALDLESLSPEEAILRLAELTYDFFNSNAAFVSITRSENLLHGRFVHQLAEVGDLSNPLIEKIDAVLMRGVKAGTIRPGIDAMQLYVSMVALSAHHINAAHTLSATFGTDLSSADWREARRAHVVGLIAAAVSRRES